MTRRVYIAGPMSRESFCRCDGDCTCPNPYQPEGETHE